MFYEVCACSFNPMDTKSQVVAYRSTFERAKQFKSELEKAYKDRIIFIRPREKVE